MAALDVNQADFTFTTPHYPGQELRVLEFRGRESISRPFELEVELVSDHADVDLEALIGEPAVLTLRGVHGERHIHGTIDRFDLLSVGRRYTRYAARLVPTLTPLRYTRRSRVFQKLDVPSIVEKVVRDAGFDARLVRRAFQHEYGVRDYCIQYQESDFDFIQRLLEEEGIFYYFDHTAELDVLVLGDSEDSTIPLEAGAAVNFRDESRASVLEEEGLFALRSTASMRPGRTAMRDFRFKQPDLDLEATRDADRFRELEVYLYPGEYVDPEIGSQLARVRLEEIQASRQRLTGTGNCRALIPGYRFSLDLHPRPDFNREYLITGIEHRGAQPASMLEEHGAGQVQEATYTSRVECIPSSVPFRPARETHRPVIVGLQSALVVGPAGEEIYCDEHGRVKVQFHWDREGRRNDQSSCWVRVSQGWAGVSFGGMMLPRIGQEVLVQFLEGDPDRPVVVGRLYNADNPVPYPLPAHKTRSTFKSHSSPGGGGFNELRFEDRKGGEEVFLHAQKDLNETVLNNHSASITANQSNSVGGNQSNTVTGDQSNTVRGKQDITITRDRTLTVTEGHERITIQAGSQTTTVQAGRSVTVKTGADSLTVETGPHSTIAKEAVTIASTSNNLAVVANKAVVMMAETETLAIQGKLAVSMASTDDTLSLAGKKAVSLVSTTDTLALGGKTEVSLASSTSSLTLSGKTKLMAFGGDEASIDAPEIKITARSKISLTVGNSSISIAPDGITLSGPKITSTAVGMHEISGALIKLN